MILKGQNEALKDYGKRLPRREQAAVGAEAGWNSWYQLWDSVDEEAVRVNADLAQAELYARVPTDAPPLRIVIDDGWQKEWGDWQPNEKFSGDLTPLVQSLKSDGFEVGLWLAPLLVKGDHSLVEEHPDWFLPSAEFFHLEHGVMRILDVTHPSVASHLQAFIQQVVSWGFDLLKIDFLF